MRIFYSWQSDTESRVARTFIREALDAAVAGLDLDEADRPTVDQDTAGVLGSPVIANTIFQKIRRANVIVADVTLTGSTPDGKRLCNSNVAIELGYALGHHGDEPLLKVMNTHYGSPKELPFDLAHRRWPVQFRLSPEAAAPERKKVHDALVKELRSILEAYLALNRPPQEEFVPAAAIGSPANWWGTESLGTTTRERKTIALRFGVNDPLIYLRIWPTAKIPPLTIQTLSDYSKSTIEPLCGGVQGWSYERNRHGILTYATVGSEGQLASTTQVFKSGEIWGVNAYLFRERSGDPKFLPTGAYEQRLRASLQKYLEAAGNSFGYPTRIAIESGLVNVNGLMLSMPDEYLEAPWGPLFENVKVSTEVDMENPQTIDRALLKIFEAVFEAAGRPRPSHLHGFPPRATT